MLLNFTGLIIFLLQIFKHKIFIFLVSQFNVGLGTFVDKRLMPAASENDAFQENPCLTDAELKQSVGKIFEAIFILYNNNSRRQINDK